MIEPDCAVPQTRRFPVGSAVDGEPLGGARIPADTPVLVDQRAVTSIVARDLLPRFGEGVWDFLGKVDVQGRRVPRDLRLDFDEWFSNSPLTHLSARQYCFARMNPRHQLVRSLCVGRHQAQKPWDEVNTFVRAREFFGFVAVRTGQPFQFAAITQDYCEEYLRFKLDRGDWQPSTGAIFAGALRNLWLLRKVMVDPVGFEPWNSEYASRVAGRRASPTCKTKEVPRPTYLGLIRAAGWYVTEFSPDIFAARDELDSYAGRIPPAPRPYGYTAQRLRAFLMSTVGPLPAHMDPKGYRIPHRAGTVNYSLILARAGVPLSAVQDPTVRKVIDEAVLQRGVAQGGIEAPIYGRRFGAPDEPWRKGFTPAELRVELEMLWRAAVIYVIAHAITRANEGQALPADCLTQVFGGDALFLDRFKHRGIGERSLVFVVPSVATAVQCLQKIAAAGSETLFAFPGRKPGFEASVFGTFIRSVNKRTADTGLHIPEPEKTITPQALRLTFCRTLEDDPMAEISAGEQLGHTRTNLIQSQVAYTLNADRDHSDIVASAQVSRRAVTLDRAADFAVGARLAGPGAAKQNALLERIERATTLRATRLDTSELEHIAAIDSYHPGLHRDCLHSPADALCGGVSAPAPELCQLECRGCAHGPQHLPEWELELESVTSVLASPETRGPYREALLLRKEKAESVIAQVYEANPTHVRGNP